MRLVVVPERAPLVLVKTVLELVGRDQAWSILQVSPAGFVGMAHVPSVGGSSRSASTPTQIASSFLDPESGKTSLTVLVLDSDARPLPSALFKVDDFIARAEPDGFFAGYFHSGVVDPAGERVDVRRPDSELAARIPQALLWWPGYFVHIPRTFKAERIANILDGILAGSTPSNSPELFASAKAEGIDEILPVTVDSMTGLMALEDPLTLALGHVARPTLDSGASAPRRPQQPRGLSVVIPTAYKESARGVLLLQECIDSMELSSTDTDVEIVLVGDADLNARYLRSVDTPFASVVRVDDALDFDFSRKVNRGVAASTHSRLVLLNDDVRCSIGGLRDLCASLSEEVAAAGPLLVAPSNLQVRAAGDTCDEDGPRHLCSNWGVAEFLESPLAESPRDVGFLTAACLAVDKDAFVDVGGFSYAYPDDFGDSDFCLKLRVAGYRLVFNPLVHATHEEMASRDRPMTTMAHTTFTTLWPAPSRVDDYWPWGRFDERPPAEVSVTTQWGVKVD